MTTNAIETMMQFETLPSRDRDKFEGTKSILFTEQETFNKHKNLKYCQNIYKEIFVNNPLQNKKLEIPEKILKIKK